MSLLKKIESFIADNAIDFIVIDELHQVKQRDEAIESQRRKLITKLINNQPFLRSRPRVLGMTATPIINNLYEGKSLIELVSGADYQDSDKESNDIQFENSLEQFKSGTFINTK